MKKNLFSMVLFLVITTVVLLIIMLFNWLPTMFQNDTLRRYGSIEEVQTSLRIKELYIPAYFPQTIAWPPEYIIAQSKPFLAVLMKFNQRGTSQEALVITQSVSRSFAEDTMSSIERITERASYPIHGVQALLEVGVCAKGETCSRLSWYEGRYQITIFMRSTPFDLIRIAQSMH